MLFLRFALPILLVGCTSAQKVRKTEQKNRIPLVVEKIEALKTVLKGREDKFEWVARGCDGMLWEGKYRAVVGGGNLAAAEREPGRFGRRPEPCWDGKDIGSKTTWSRDMAVGLVLWLWRSGDFRTLERHYQFGKENHWAMGFPKTNRVYYTPQMKSFLTRTIRALGGSNHSPYKWNALYFPGKLDYAAHLEVLQIVARSEIEGSIPKIALARLKEHAKRAPRNPLYAASLVKFGGSSSDAIESCLVPKFDTYVRCDDGNCRLIEQLFACDLILRALGGNEGS